MARIIGIDFGTRRIGLAMSDPTATIAQPLPALTRRAGKRPPVQAIANLVREHDVSAIVVGLPLSLAGDETDWTREVREFGAALAERSGVPVSFLDERMTSVHAEKTVRALGLKRRERERKDRIDTAAALLILQAFLDRRPRD
ncbi:MAG TPA: Holliday junction resolvase RuvX [Longimicrobiales bacterium]|nr:Holliday junction resolvase RuvX [Longimicrobiales bacterium]